MTGYISNRKREIEKTDSINYLRESADVVANAYRAAKRNSGKLFLAAFAAATPFGMAGCSKDEQPKTAAELYKVPRLKAFAYNSQVDQEVDEFVRNSIRKANIGEFRSEDEVDFGSRQAAEEAIKKYDRELGCRIAKIPVPNESKIYLMYKGSTKLGEITMVDGRPAHMELQVKSLTPLSEEAGKVIGKGVDVLGGIWNGVSRMLPK